ncbi:unnamed protein product [Gadus morhua 'NCC']|jgi:hypothetical protein
MKRLLVSMFSGLCFYIIIEQKFSNYIALRPAPSSDSAPLDPAEGPTRRAQPELLSAPPRPLTPLIRVLPEPIPGAPNRNSSSRLENKRLSVKWWSLKHGKEEPTRVKPS